MPEPADVEPDGEEDEDLADRITEAKERLISEQISERQDLWHYEGQMPAFDTSEYATLDVESMEGVAGDEAWVWYRAGLVEGYGMGIHELEKLENDE